MSEAAKVMRGTVQKGCDESEKKKQTNQKNLLSGHNGNGLNTGAGNLSGQAVSNRGAEAKARRLLASDGANKGNDEGNGLDGHDGKRLEV